MPLDAKRRGFDVGHHAAHAQLQGKEIRDNPSQVAQEQVIPSIVASFLSPIDQVMLSRTPGAVSRVCGRRAEEITTL